MPLCTDARFLKDVARHEMKVVRDDGLYRHIRFKRPDTICMYFDLITWPGHLCYTGDMGTFVFTRLKDMFEFFRTDRNHMHLGDGMTLTINPGYWAEKLIAVDSNRRNGSATEFSEDKFRQVINEHRIRWVREAREDGSLDRDERRELWEAVEDEVLGALGDDGEQAAYIAARDFIWRRRHGEREWMFHDLWDYDFTQYTRTFLWCCYALAWGIAKYDERTKETMEAA